MPPQVTAPAASGDAAASRATLPLTLLMQTAASAATIAPAVAAPALLAALDVGPVAVGVYVAVVYAAAMLSSQWGAALVRRWGPIRTSQIALVLDALGVMLVAVPHVGVALLGALLLGTGYGPITPASSEILARSTPPERYALVFSLKQTGVPAGGVVAGLVVPSALHLGGAVLALGVVAALCALGALLGAVVRGELDRWRDADAPLPGLARWLAPVRFVASHRTLFTLAMCSLVFSAVQVCITSYTVTYLHHDLGWTLVAAGTALAVAQAAGVGGRVLWGVIADRSGDARRVLIALAAAMAVGALGMAVFDAQSAHLAVIGWLAVYGATGVGWNGVFLATIARVVPVAEASAATSGSLFFTYFGVVVGPPLFGVAGDALGRLGPAYALLAVPLGWTLVALWRWRSEPAPARAAGLR